MRSNAVYIYIEFNREFAITSSPRHPKRDVTDTGKIKFHCTLLEKGYCTYEQTQSNERKYALKFASWVIFAFNVKLLGRTIYVVTVTLLVVKPAIPRN